MNVAYNMDCMEGMKQYPDKYFDLAVVDPPYGDGSQNVQVERERSEVNRANWHGKHKYHLGVPDGGGLGRQSMQKNYFVGCCSWGRVF